MRVLVLLLALVAPLWAQQIGGPLQVTPRVFSGTGILRSGPVIQHVRLASSTVAGVVQKNITWPSAWPDTNYLANCAVEDNTTSSVTRVRIHHVIQRTTTQVVLLVENSDVGARSVTYHCVGWHQ